MVQGWKARSEVADDGVGEFGFPLEGRDFPIWPENELAFRAFLRVRTQWITGAGGATGLDFNAVERKVMRFVRQRKLSQDEEDRILDDLDVMETVIVSEWAKESERRARDTRGKRRL